MRQIKYFRVCCLLVFALMLGLHFWKYFDHSPINIINSSQIVSRNMILPLGGKQSIFSKTVYLKFHFKTGVQAFRHDMTKWNADDSICDNLPPDLRKENLHTSFGDTPIYVHNPRDDIYVSGSLVRSSTWEPDLLKLMASHLSKDKELQFIDLGANIGVFSLAMAKYGRQVISVEPLSINLHRFCSSIRAGNFTENITVIYNALSDKRENVSLGIDSRNIGGTYVVTEKNINKVSASLVRGQYKDMAMTAKLDDLLDLPGFNVKKVVIKMDVEGCEHLVLNGGVNFFNQVNVPAILMEWMWHRKKSSARKIISFFTKRDYKPYSPSSTPLKTSLSHTWPTNVIWIK